MTVHPIVDIDVWAPSPLRIAGDNAVDELPWERVLLLPPREPTETEWPDETVAIAHLLLTTGATVTRGRVTPSGSSPAPGYNSTAVMDLSFTTALVIMRAASLPFLYSVTAGHVGVVRPSGSGDHIPRVPLSDIPRRYQGAG